MRRNLLTMVIAVIMTPISAFTQITDKKANPSGRKEASADVRGKQEIKNLTEDFRAAMLVRDVAAVERLYSEDIIITGRDGRVSDKTNNLDSFRANPNEVKYDSYDFEEMVIHVYGDMAVNNCIVAIKGHSKNGEFNISVRSTTTFIKRQGRWQIVAVHTSPLIN